MRRCKTLRYKPCVRSWLNKEQAGDRNQTKARTYSASADDRLLHLDADHLDVPPNA
jgi:hypothetical protein